MIQNVRLDELCIPKSSNLAQKDLLENVGEYPVYGASGFIRNVNFFHQESEYIAVVKDGAGIGRAMLLPAKSSIIGTMQYLIPKNNVDTKFLYYAVKSMNLSKYFSGATIPHIYFKDYKKELVPLYSKDKQKLISSSLEKLENIVTKRQQQLKEYDQLIKSRFVEMFMEKDYPRMKMSDVSRGKGEYGAGSASILFDNTRPRYVRITDINDDGTLNDDFVSSINHSDDNTYRLEYGDFMFARMGATVGKTYAYLEGNQIYAGYLIRYRLNINLINPRYLFYYTKMKEYEEWVKSNQSGAAQPGINAKKYGFLEVPVAPIELQNQFAIFVEQVDKLKFEVQKSLNETQTLFDSLMQEYFG